MNADDWRRAAPWGRVKRRGAPRHPSGASLLERWVWRVDLSEPTSCWPWKGTINQRGYGGFRPSGRRAPEKRAHRLAWELAHGPIPDGLQVLHRCDNPACVRPSHLFLGTNLDNIADKVAKGRQYSKLKADEVRKIRALYEEGVTHLALSRRFGVTLQTVSLIIRRRTWRHLS